MRVRIRNALATAPSQVLARLHRLTSDTRGVAAVEFAMILPIMFFLFVGTIEFGQALAVDRRVTLTASSSGDLIARVQKGITSEELDSELQIIKQLIRPYDESALTVRIVNVVAKGKKGSVEYKVNWSKDNHGGTPYESNSDYSNMPENIIKPGAGVIVAEAIYNYTPLIFNYFIKSAFDMEDRFFFLPRGETKFGCVKLDEQAGICSNL
ncbi:MAG: TadE/TadG family type IV pilus assembly protein [Hyphomicrobiaceae bacterium]